MGQGTSTYEVLSRAVRQYTWQLFITEHVPCGYIDFY